MSGGEQQTAFICLQGHGALNRKKLDVGPVMECAICGGVLTRSEELRKFIAPAYVRALWKRAHTFEGNAAQQCPKCGGGMPLVSPWDGESAPSVPTCPECQLHWIAADQMEKLPTLADNPALRRRKLSTQEKRQRIADDIGGPAIEIESLAEGAEGSRWRYVAAMMGFPIVEGLARAKSTPWVTWSVVALSFVVTWWSFLSGGELAFRWGLVPADALRHGGVTFVTSFFMHAGWMHLLGNAYFLMLFGPHVENDLGVAPYAALLFAGGIAGDLLHMALDLQSTIPLVGASTGISAVLGFFALSFPHARLKYNMGIFFKFSWLVMTAKAAFVMWLLLQLWGAFTQVLNATSTSFFGHLGGVIVGVGLWVIVVYGSKREAA